MEIQTIRQRERIDANTRAVSVKSGKYEIISQSPKYQKVIDSVHQVATTDSTVLILGETGTGKELLARLVHQQSPRSHRELIRVNCATLPENLVESELFGHERGAFTGANQQKIGRFELADDSSIFLDEIGEVSLNVQSKLLRVLQEGEFERVGGSKTLVTNVRVIAATNRNLEKMVEEGTFRSDLYYRLNVFPIRNIPLRERPEDIEPLVYHFIKKYNARMGRSVEYVESGDLKRLRAYAYPGNIRELEHIIERSIILSEGKKLEVGALPKKNSLSFKKNAHTLDEVIEAHIRWALTRTDGKVSGTGGAADLLGLNPQTLFSKMRKFSIKR